MTKRSRAIVIGLPIHEDGGEGEQAKRAGDFGAWLQEAVGVPCVFYDERFTSYQADLYLEDSGLTKQKRKARRGPSWGGAGAAANVFGLTACGGVLVAAN